MRRRVAAAATAAGSLLILAVAWKAEGQAPANPNQVAAKVERAPLYLISPDRYQVPSLLEPIRRVQVMTTSDGVLKSISLPIGSSARDGQEIAQVDAAEATAKSRVALAVVKQRQAELDFAKAMVLTRQNQSSDQPIAEAKLDAAKAEAELAQIALDRCVLRAPFGGRILAVPFSAGQYLPKGSTVVELADVTSLRALIPVDRSAVKVGTTLTLTVEGKGVSASIQAILPLDESRAALRELASPMASAWVTIPNSGNAFEPGQRIVSPYLPNAPIAAVPSYSVKQDEEGSSIVQVIRAERVTNVKVKVIGALGPDRSQVSGVFRPSDVLIQSSSVPLASGTFIRFGDAATATGVEGTPPDPTQYGEPAAIGRPESAPSRKAAPKETRKGVVPF